MIRYRLTAGLLKRTFPPHTLPVRHCFITASLFYFNNNELCAGHVKFAGHNLKVSRRRHVCVCWLTNILHTTRPCTCALAPCQISHVQHQRFVRSPHQTKAKKYTVTNGVSQTQHCVVTENILHTSGDFMLTKQFCLQYSAAFGWLCCYGIT